MTGGAPALGFAVMVGLAAAAGILLVDDDRVVTRAYNDPVVVELDGMQVETGEGPCLNAAFEGGTIYGTWSMTHVGLASAPRPTPRASAACSPFDCPTGDRALSTFAPA